MAIGVPDEKQGIDLGDYLPQKYPNIPSRFILRPEAYRPRYWQDKALNYWENPQRVARYKQVIKAQPQGYVPPEWIDEKTLDVIDRTYNELQKQNGNEMWWNWRPLPYNHALSSELRQLKIPPLRVLQDMGEERFYTPAPEEELEKPSQGGMTDEQWDALPRWQRLLVGFMESPVFSGGMGAIAGIPLGATIAGVPGAVVGGIVGAAGGIYAQQKPESSIAKLLLYLDYPREWLEQTMGTTEQIIRSATDPKKYGAIPTDDWDSLWGYLQDAWQAGHIYTQGMGVGFETPGGVMSQAFMQGAMPINLTQTNLDVLNSLARADIELDPFLDWLGSWVPGWESWTTPPGLEKVAPPGYIWQAGLPEPQPAPPIAAAMYDIRSRIAKGESPEALVQEYTQKYGISGDIREIISGFVIDPLDWAPVVGNKAVSKAMYAMGKYDLGVAFGTTHGVTEGLQKYGIIKRKTTPISELKNSNAMVRFLAGVTKEGDVKILEGAPYRGGLFGHLLRMKPANRATEVLSTSAENLAIVLSRLDDPTPEQLTGLIKALAETPEDVARELSMRSINAPDGAAIPMFLKDFAPTADELLLRYQATETLRRLLNNIAEITEKTPGEVIAQIDNASDAEILLRQYVDIARTRGDETSRAIVDAYDASRSSLADVPPEQQLTGAKLQEMVQVFAKDGLPHDIDTFRAQLYTAAIDKAAEWAADWFGVEPDPTWVQASQMIKSAQSLLLLGLNPVYFINNVLNNTVTAAAVGVLGLRSAKQIDEIWARAGITPTRLRAGVGPISLGEELNFAAIKKAVQPDSNAITNTTRFFNEKTGKLQIFSNLSMKHEQFASAQAMTAGFVQFMSRHWREGTGFSRMPAPLERALAQIDKNLPAFIYSAIRGGMNQAEIEKALWGGLTRRTLDDAIPELVNSLRERGADLSEADVAELLAHSGVDKILRDKLSGAKTDREVRDIFTEVNQIIQDNLDQLAARDIERTAANVAGRAANEGFPAVLELWDQRNIEFAERWFENFAEWERAFEATANLDYASKNAVMRAVAAEQKRKWLRYYANERTKYQAIVNGLGIDSENARKIITLVDQQQQNFKEFYELRNRKNAEFFSKKFGSKEERRVAWDTLQAELLEAYNAMTSKENYLQGEMDSAFVEYMATKYGPEAGDAAALWREGVQGIREDMQTEMRAMREALRTMPVSERRTEWTRFLHARDGYMSQIADLFVENTQGAHDLYNRLRGREQAPATGVPEPPPGGVTPEGVTPPPGTGEGIPLMVTMGMRDAIRRLGYSADEARNMTPQEMWDIINSETPADAPEPPAAPEPGTPGPVQDLSPVGRKVKVNYKGEVYEGTIVDSVKIMNDGIAYARVLREGQNNNGVWVPLEAIDGIGDRVREAYQVPETLGPSAQQRLAENAKLASDYGIPLLDESGNRISGAEVHLLNAIKKYNPTETLGKGYNRVADVPTEVVRKALEERARVHAAAEPFDPMYVVNLQEAAKTVTPVSAAQFSKEALQEFAIDEPAIEKLVDEGFLEELEPVTDEEGRTYEMYKITEKATEADVSDLLETYIPVEGEPHPIHQAIFSGELDKLPERVRTNYDEALSIIVAEVDIAEKGTRIAKEADGMGSTKIWTGVESTYPDWWGDLKNPVYRDANGVKYTGKNAATKALADLVAGTVNKKNKKGDNYIIVDRLIGAALDIMDAHPERFTDYHMALGNYDAVLGEAKYSLAQAHVDIAKPEVWSNPRLLEKTLQNLNDEVMVKISELPYEAVSDFADEAFGIQDTILARINELSQVPPDELTQLAEDINRLATSEISQYEATNVAYDFQLYNQEPPTDLMIPKRDAAYTAAARAGLFRRELKRKWLEYFIAQQDNVLQGTWDAREQIDAFFGLHDARAFVWARDTGRYPWEYYEHTFADVTTRAVDIVDDVYILQQHTSNRNTEGYANFIENNQLIDENGELVQLYHGTTHEFTSFDVSKANIESHYGSAIYLSDNVDDVNVNYAGYGPDLQNKVEARADFISSWLSSGNDDFGGFVDEIAEYLGRDVNDLWQLIDDLGTDALEAIFPLYSDIETFANWLARKQVAGDSEGMVMPVYARMENPARLVNDKPTMFDIGEYFLMDYDMVADMLESSPEDFINEIRDYYGRGEDWNPGPEELRRLMEDDRYDIADQISSGAQENSKIELLVEALARALHDTGTELPAWTAARDWINELLWEHPVYLAENQTAPLSEIVKFIRDKLNTHTIMVETATGYEFGTGEIAQAFLRELGYDGIIMDAHNSFPGMDIPPGTRHYVLWQPERVKSIFNMGDFDPNNPDLLYQRRWYPETPRNEAALDVNINWNPATDIEPVHGLVPMLASEHGAFVIFRNPEGGYALQSTETGLHYFDTLHEARRVAWEQAYSQSQKGNILFQEVESNQPWYYSPLKKIVEDKMPNRQPPDQLLAMIQKGGVKADELYWTGIEDFLVRRKAIADAIDNNELLIVKIGTTEAQYRDAGITDLYYIVLKEHPNDPFVEGKPHMFDEYLSAQHQEFDTTDLKFTTEEEANQFLNRFRSLSKEEVLSYLDANRVEITEATKGYGQDSKRMAEIQRELRSRTGESNQILDVFTNAHYAVIHYGGPDGGVHPEYQRFVESGRLEMWFNNQNLFMELQGWTTTRYSRADYPFPETIKIAVREKIGPEVFDYYMSRIEEAQRLREDLHEASSRRDPSSENPRFAQYVLESNTGRKRNYGEMVLMYDGRTPHAQTLYNRMENNPELDWRREIDDIVIRYDPRYGDSIEKMISEGKTPEEFANDMGRLLRNMNRRLAGKINSMLPTGEMPVKANHYSAGHYHEPNVITHIRYSDYIDTDGKRVLYLEEVQSDWHQQGRKKGYRVPVEIDQFPDVDEIMQIYKNKYAELQELYRIYDALKEVYRQADEAYYDFLGTPESHVPEFEVRYITGRGTRSYRNFETMEEAANFAMQALRSYPDWHDYNQYMVMMHGPDWDMMSLVEGTLSQPRGRLRLPNETEVRSYSAESPRLKELENIKDNARREMRDAEKTARNYWFEVVEVNPWSATAENKSMNQISDINAAPFSNNKWGEMAMKRMLRYAAENGYDRLSWSVARVQNERWNLARYYESVEWHKRLDDDGSIKEIEITTVSAENGQENTFYTSADRLHEYLGDGVAEHIINNEEMGGVLQGEEDLAVGKGGMDFFYDNVLVKAVDKATKKFGVKSQKINLVGAAGSDNLANFTVEDINTGAKYQIWTDDGRVWEANRYISPEELRARHGEPVELTPAETLAHPERIDWHGEYTWELVTDVQADNPRALLEALGLDPDYDLRTIAGETFDAWGVDLPPELVESLHRAQPLFSQKKGAVQFTAEGKAIIYALQAPDISTAVHELGHVFRLDLRRTIDMAKDEVTKARLLADYETASKWAGAVQDVDGEYLWSGEAAHRYGVDSDEYRAAVRAEEKFARGFEEYLMGGEAPSPQLQTVFEKFKEWMSHIYARLRGQLAGLTPEMKAVYDRLLTEYPEAGDYQFNTEMGRAKVPVGANMFQPSPPLNTHNFVRWFLDSKVVNPDGTPMKLYHGTKHAFIAFDPNESQDFGFHLGTLEQAEAIIGSKYVARQVGIWARGGNVIEVYASIRNPLRVNDYEWWGGGLGRLMERMDQPETEYGGFAMKRKVVPFLKTDEMLRNAEWIANELRNGVTTMVAPEGMKQRILDTFAAAGYTWQDIVKNQYVFEIVKKYITEQQIKNRKNANRVIIAEFERLGYDGMVYSNQAEGKGDSWIAFRAEQIKSVRNVGDWNPQDARLMYQDGLPIEYENGYTSNLLYQEDIPAPNSPLGEVDGNTPGLPMSEVQEEGYRNHIRPIMDGLEGLLTGPNAQDRSRLANATGDLEPEVSASLKKYTEQVYGQLADTKLAGVRWAENRRDAALLNYSRRYGFDNILTAIFPYQFWYTRSALQWALRFIDKPGWLSNYARIRNMQRTTMQTPGFPMRLKDKVKVPIPFLPDWAMGGMYMDPFRQLFPFEQFFRPWEQRDEDRNMIEKRAVSDIQDQVEAGELGQQEAIEAIQNRSGPVWEKAYTAAELEVESSSSNAWDFMNLIMSPALPIGWGYNWATGQKDKIGQLPATRLMQNVSGALGANEGRGWNMEGPLRRALDLPEQSRYHDYNVDKALSDLVAEGKVPLDDALIAMTDRSGDAYLLAQQREADRQQLKYLGSSVGADIFPEGEVKMRSLKQQYDKAWDAKNAGQDDALNRFWDKYPEYEARNLLFKEGEDRLRQLLISKIWDGYLNEELPALYKDQLEEGLGDTFMQAFVNKETRSYDSIDTETLSQWARVFTEITGGTVPETAPKTPEAQLKLSSPEDAALYQAYVDERESKFGNIGHVLSVFYEAPEEAQDSIKRLLPQIDDYYEWRNEQFAKNPDLIQYAISDTSKVADAPKDVQVLYYQFQYQRQELFPDIFEIQDEYYKIPENNKAAKKAFKEQYPQLEEYWTWRREFMRQYPNMIPYLMSQESLANAVLGDEGGTSYSSGGSSKSSSGKKYVTFEDGSKGWVVFDKNGMWHKTSPPKDAKKKGGDYENYSINVGAIPAPLKEKLMDYYKNGTPLGKIARNNLRQYWNKIGKPGTKLNYFIDNILRFEMDAPKEGLKKNFDFDIQLLDPVVMKRLFAYYELDEPLTKGALKSLKLLWWDLGKPGDTLDTFIDEIIRSKF